MGQGLAAAINVVERHISSISPERSRVAWSDDVLATACAPSLIWGSGAGGSHAAARVQTRYWAHGRAEPHLSISISVYQSCPWGLRHGLEC